MSNVASKGTMSAFQRWEMASFGEETPTPTQTVEQVVRAREITRENQLEIERLKDEARRLGFTEGHSAGLIAGRIEGQEKLDAEVSQFCDLAKQFSGQLSIASKAIGEDVFKLALDLAQAMVLSKLEIDPDTIIPIILDAIESLPTVQQPAQVNLHPVDAALVKANIGDRLSAAGWRIVSDARIERGGCTLETAQNIIDATFDNRWQRLTDSIKSSLSSIGSPSC
jgi:flagellar assembly protein FliH